GDCSSAGCYAMTDEQIQEIYPLGRAAFLGGQKTFQVPAYPFRMTALNMAKHRTHPAMPSRRLIKKSNDHYMVHESQPKADVCEKRYVFDAEPAPGMSFRAKDKCPTFSVRAEVASAVKEKSDKDEREFNALANKGIATVAVRTGTDGGMHPTFLAKLRPQEALFDNDGRFRPVMPSNIPLPANVNPPRAPQPEADTTSSVAAAQPEPPAKPKAVYSTPAGARASPAPPPATTPHPAAANPPTAVAKMAAPPANPAPSNPAASKAAPASPFPNPAPAAQGSGMMTGATPV